eukprot:978885-Pyramimonas_sp.AAC.1
MTIWTLPSGILVVVDTCRNRLEMPPPVCTGPGGLGGSPHQCPSGRPRPGFQGPTPAAGKSAPTASTSQSRAHQGPNLPSGSLVRVDGAVPLP